MTTITTTNQKRESLKKIKLDSYTGEWVAFINEKVIAHNKELKDLIRGIEAKGLRKKASIFLVPRKDEGPYVLIIL